MIDSPNSEENKTSDAEMFFAQFQEGAPAKTESKADPEFDVQMEKRIAEPVKQQTFKEAFAAHRSAGDKVFEFNGKKYTTEMAGAKSAQPATKPAKTVASTAPASFESVKSAVKTTSPHSMKSDTNIYADNFIQDGINKIKSKLSDKGSSSKTLPNGRPNLTAAV